MPEQTCIFAAKTSCPNLKKKEPRKGVCSNVEYQTGGDAPAVLTPSQEFLDVVPCYIIKGTIIEPALNKAHLASSVTSKVQAKNFLSRFWIPTQAQPS